MTPVDDIVDIENVRENRYMQIDTFGELKELPEHTTVAFFNRMNYDTKYNLLTRWIDFQRKRKLDIWTLEQALQEKAMPPARAKVEVKIEMGSIEREADVIEGESVVSEKLMTKEEDFTSSVDTVRKNVCVAYTKSNSYRLAIKVNNDQRLISESGELEERSHKVKKYLSVEEMEKKMKTMKSDLVEANAKKLNDRFEVYLKSLNLSSSLKLFRIASCPESRATTSRTATTSTIALNQGLSSCGIATVKPVFFWITEDERDVLYIGIKESGGCYKIDKHGNTGNLVDKDKISMCPYQNITEGQKIDFGDLWLRYQTKKGVKNLKTLLDIYETSTRRSRK